MTASGAECRLPAEKGSATSGEARTDTSWRLPASRHRRLLALLFDPAPETEPPLAAEDQGRLATTNQTAEDAAGRFKHSE